MVKKILNIVLWVATGVALALLFMSGRKRYLDTPISGIRVNIERGHDKGFVDDDSLVAYAEAVSGIARGAASSSVDMQRINRMMEDNPWIERGSAYIGLDNMLTINAKEYEPVMRIYDQDGKSSYITNEGIIIPSSPHYTPHLIIASGNFNDSTDVTEALSIAQAISGDDYLASHIGQIYRNRDNEYELAVNNLPARVVIGDTQAIGDKLWRLRTLLEKYYNTEELTVYKTLDLRYKNQIVCTKKIKL